MSTPLVQNSNESLWDFFVRMGKDPKKFGIKPEVSKGKKRVAAVRRKIEVERYSLNHTVVEDDMFKSFIQEFYNKFEYLNKKYNHNSIKTFLVSLISYINDGKISRRRIYEFVNTFDKEDKIRKMTWETYNYNVKLEDWHHIGGCFSQFISSTFERTEDTETNGVDGKVCSLYICPNNLLNYIDDTYKVYKNSGKIELDVNYNI